VLWSSWWGQERHGPHKAGLSHFELAKVEAGEFDTFLVEPDLQHVGGVFKKGKDAKLHLWVTADDRRIVVKAKSKVVVGHFVAELISTEGVSL